MARASRQGSKSNRPEDACEVDGLRLSRISERLGQQHEDSDQARGKREHPRPTQRAAGTASNESHPCRPDPTTEHGREIRGSSVPAAFVSKAALAFEQADEQPKRG